MSQVTGAMTTVGGRIGSGVRFLVGGVITSGKCICLAVFTAWSICDCKLETGKKQGPASLTWVETFGTLDIFTFTFMHLADAFIQSDLQLHSGYTFSLVSVFPGNRTHNLLRC